MICMEIKVELDQEKVDNDYLVFTDNGFDSPDNWISIKLCHPKTNTFEKLGDIRVDDLMPALIAFDAKHSRKNQPTN